MTRHSYCRTLLSTILLSAVLLQQGCANYARKAGSMQSFLQSGNIEAASAIAEKQDRAEKDVLACMNKGMLRRMKGDYAGSNAILEVAKRKIDDLYGVSVSEQLGALTVNDTLRSYSGDRYEQVLLHAYMALNYIDLGDLDAARVEMLQADVKMREWGEQPEEDPFVRYLSGIIYEMLGEKDEALVSYRRAKQLYLDAANRQPVAMPQQLKKDLLRLLWSQGFRDEYHTTKHQLKMDNYVRPKRRNNTGDLVVVLNNGLAPVRGENVIQTFATEIENMVRIALPRYKNKKQALKAARVMLDGKAEYRFETVEDVDALARQALDDDIAIITTRAIARAVVKHTTQKKAKDKDPLAGFIASVANMVTERADTRSWTTLPAEIQLSRIELPAGSHTVTIELLNPAQRVVDSIERVVDIKPGRTILLSQHWIAPRPVVVSKAK